LFCFYVAFGILDWKMDQLFWLWNLTSSLNIMFFVFAGFVYTITNQRVLVKIVNITLFGGIPNLFVWSNMVEQMTWPKKINLCDNTLLYIHHKKKEHWPCLLKDKIVWKNKNSQIFKETFPNLIGLNWAFQDASFHVYKLNFVNHWAWSWKYKLKSSLVLLISMKGSQINRGNMIVSI